MARQAAISERHCSGARTMEILQDPWSFLVLRECFFGAHRFEQFQKILSLPRNTLVKRLKKLSDLGLLDKLPYTAGGQRFEYRLSEQGRDLYPAMLSLLRFGDTWLSNGETPPLQLIHRTCGKACKPVVACSVCNETVHAHDVQPRSGPGAGVAARTMERQRSRRASDPAIFERMRPSSVARTLGIIGDRWSFLVLREMLSGVRRFDEFQSGLGIATNILTDRLQMLTERGVVEKRPCQGKPARHEYRLTAMGRDLYGPMIVMMHWGDKWLSRGKPPLLLRHRLCQHDFFAQVVCDQCGIPLDPYQMQYRLSYQLAEPQPASPAQCSDDPGA